MNVRKIVAVLALSLLLSTASGGYLYYHSARDAAVREAEGELVARSQLLRDRIVRLISAHKMEARALALFEELQEALLNTNPGAVSHANRILDHFVKGLGDEVCYLVDRAGNTIASSNRNEGDSFVGKNYSFRPYFHEALEGKPSTYLALGATSGMRGIYCSHPVYPTGNDSPIGLAVIKASVADIEREISETNGGIALLVHSSGIIFASSQPNWLFHFLWQATPEDVARVAESKQFGNGPWNGTGLENTADRQVVDKSGETYLIQERDIENCPGWRLVYLYSFKSLSRKLVDPLVGWTGYSGLALFILVAVAVVILYGMAHRDLLTRKQVEEALQAERAKFETLAENAPFGLVMIADDGAFQYVNPKFQEIFGYELEDVPNGKEWFKKAYPDSDYRTEVIRTWLQDAKEAKPGEPRPKTFTVTCKNGTRKTAHFVPVHLTTGQHVITCEDITERKRAEEALRKSENRFQQLMEHSPMAIAVSDMKGEVEYLNKKFIELFGYTIQDIPTLEHWWRLAYSDPQNAEQVRSEWLSTTREAGAKGTEAEPREREVRCKDGTSRVIDFRKTVIDKWVIHTLLDVTENKRHKEALRESEQMFRLLSEQSLMSVAILQDGVYKYTNQAMSDLCEYSAEEIAAWGPEEFLAVVHPDDRSAVMEQARMKQAGDPFQKTNYSFRIVTKSGRTKWVEIYSKTIQFQDRSANLLTMVDITGRKQAEERLLQSQKMEAIGTLAGGIAHDINNLLQIVLGQADMLLLRAEMDEKSGRSVEAIRRAARNGADLVSRILTFSRKSEPQMRAINLSEEVRRVDELLRRTIPGMIGLEMSLEDNLRMINGDPSQIEQILLNLAANARDAMPEGGRLVFETGNATIREEYCRTHPEVKPGKYVLLTVSDTGQGMARGILDRIFEPFFTTKQPGEGTGLGLSMVFGVVKNHGGHVTCYSEAGVGSTFKVYFPALAEALQPDLATTIEMPAGGTETLLLVDDEDAVRTLGAEMLELAGYTVLTAANGREALEVFRNNRESIALVILDLVMPEMSGRKCLEALLKMNPNAKVLIASGYAANGPAKEARESGAAGFVSKPFDLKQILVAIRKILDRVCAEH